MSRMITSGISVGGDLKQGTAIGHNADHLKFWLKQTLAGICHELVIVGNQQSCPRLTFHELHSFLALNSPNARTELYAPQEPKPYSRSVVATIVHGGKGKSSNEGRNIPETENIP